MKRYSVRNIALIIFVVLQMILYVTFLTIDINGGSILISRNIKYTIIILCFCYAYFFGKRADKGILFCIKAGLLFTVISDLFLLMLDYYTEGVLTFIVVQQFYGIRIILADPETGKGQKGSADDRSCKKLLLHKFTLRISMELFIAFTACLILRLAGISLELILIISAFYFICITTNTITSIKSVVLNHRNKQNVFFAAGMSLFLLCDINVGLFNLSGFISLPGNIYDILYAMSTILMWAFYAPSQILIALSASVPDHSKAI